MSAADVAAIVVTVLAALAVAALAVVLAATVRTLGEVRDALVEVRTRTDGLVVELEQAVGEARDGLDRVDRLLGTAEGISAAVSSTSRIAQAALSTPVIKTVALASGTQRAARRLRRAR
ncbi:MAG: hypothetical protein IPM45_02225 [Acidimicrobiales bacterium]|nr:hypothetical protein [Acidimicrobiales bacterium]